jgi:flagellar L-ring protein precursor FlgH
LARPHSTCSTRPFRLAGLLLVAVSLNACNALQRVAEIGRPPAMSAIQDPRGIVGRQPVQMPQPAPVAANHQPNSLWRPGSQHFLQDQRAAKVGDIVTVDIEIQDKAEISNSTNRSRTAAEDSSASSVLGYEASLTQLLPSALDPTSLIDLDSSGSTEGTGSIQRDETINLSVAALVIQVLPNGNLVIAGRQEVRVNFEMRELQVAGIIRPEDIASTNTIAFDQIAEARIAYGGRGTLSDLQQPRYGQQIFDILWPF